MRAFPPDNPAVERLGEEIFGLVQDAQGKGFVSDGIVAVPTTRQLFGVIRFHLKHTRRAARIMEKWLKRHREY